MDRANYELAWYLADQAGARVHLVSHFVAPPLAEHPNVTWHRVAKPFNSYALAEPRLEREGRRIAESLRGEHPRVIVNGGNCSWGDVNWVHYVHAAYRPEVERGALRRWKTSWSHGRFLAAERKALTAARVIVANSLRTRNDVIENFGLPAERVHPVYYGINDHEFTPPTAESRRAARAALGWDHDRPTAIFVGALGDRRKGFDVAFAAWEELCGRSDWDVDLVAVGAGAGVEWWRARAAAGGLDQRVRMMGFTRDVPLVMAAADLLISPTRYEAYGLGVHEALCSGLPAFVTRGAGVAERYPEALTELLLNDPPEADDLAAKLLRWHAAVHGYRERAYHFGATLRQRSWSEMAQQMIEIIEANAAG
jgi:glycosyltransferase involved in cell wall biosynthesis